MFFLVQISYEEGRKVENCTGGECRLFLSYSVKFLVYTYLTQNGFYPSYCPVSDRFIFCPSLYL